MSPSCEGKKKKVYFVPFSRISPVLHIQSLDNQRIGLNCCLQPNDAAPLSSEA